MKRTMLRTLAPALLGGALVLAGCAQATPEVAEPTAATTSAAAAPTSGPAPVPTEGSVRLADGTVLANAKVLPVHVVDLGFEAGGVVADIAVQPGDKVSAGQVLGSLDTRNLALEVEGAKAQLAEARANYDRLTEGATPAELAQAKAAVAEAQARLEAQQAAVSEKEIAAAEAQLREARAAQAQLLAGPRAEDIAALQAAVDNARSRLQTRADALAAEKARRELQVEQVANQLRNAQDEYSRIQWANRNVSEDPAKLPQGAIDAEAAAKRAMENAERDLDEARLSLEEARKAEVTETATYQAELREAEARLNQVLAPALPADKAAADKAVAEAQARLDQLRGKGRSSNIAISVAELDQAQAGLNRLIEDPQTSLLAVAEARVAAAEVQLKQAELAIERAQVRSPIDGTVASISVEPGQVVDDRSPAMVVADLTSWQLVTADLNELSVSQIRENDPVQVTFYALPGLQLTGKVKYIETIGRESGVGTSYTVTVIPDNWDERLRWNMSAQVVFSAAVP
jgi:HlyD family secretion protein